MEIKSRRLQWMLLVILLSHLLISSSEARQVEDWPYDRLFREAHLVMIGTVVKVKASEEKWPERFGKQDRFEAVETIFEASSFLKGKSLHDVPVIHFKYRQGSRPYEDGPGFVSFRGKSVAVETKSAKTEPGELKSKQREVREVSRPEYLLFLKGRADGRYEPVSGQLDPQLSVRALFEAGSVVSALPGAGHAPQGATNARRIRLDHLARINKKRIPMDMAVLTLCFLPPNSILGPHTFAEADIYVNPQVLDYRRKNPYGTAYPTGSVFVKKKYSMPRQGVRQEKPDSIATVMVKKANKGQVTDWEFSFLRLRDGQRINPPDRASCVECHRGYQKRGYLSEESENALQQYLGSMK